MHLQCKSMVLSPSQIDKISEELRSFHRAETRTKKIRKLEPSFYHNVVAALETLSEESNRYLQEKDIGQYIKIKDGSSFRIFLVLVSAL